MTSQTTRIAVRDRFWTEKPKVGRVAGDDKRSLAERDYGRVLHSGAFRRLQGKSQVVNTNHPDYFRTRLTHTLEVSQIGRSLSEGLARSEASLQEHWPPYLVETACLIHDLGHPPFGHNGEAALKEWMASKGSSFEANAQSFRIVAFLEVKFPRESFENGKLDGPAGLNLSKTVLRASFKYPYPKSLATKNPEKFGYYEDGLEARIAEWVLDGRKAELVPAAEIVEYADDIAYSVHDLEDGIRAHMIPIELLVHDAAGEREEFLAYHRKRLKESPERPSDEVLGELLSSGMFDSFVKPYGHTAPERGRIKEMTSGLIDRFISAVHPDPTSSLGFSMKPTAAAEIKLLMSMTWRYVIESQQLQTLQYRERRIIRELAEAMMAEPALFAAEQRDAIQAAGCETKCARVVCDYLAGMTDRFASSFHARLFGTESQLITDTL